MASPETTDLEDSQIPEHFTLSSEDSMTDSQFIKFYATLTDSHKLPGFDELMEKYIFPSKAPLKKGKEATKQAVGWVSANKEKVVIGMDNMDKASKDNSDGGWITVKPKKVRVSSNQSQWVHQNLEVDKMKLPTGMCPIMLAIIQTHCPWMLQLGPPIGKVASKENTLPFSEPMVVMLF